MQVQHLVERRRVETHLGAVRLQIRQRDLRGLLHHVSELTRERQSRLSRHRRRLDEQHVTTSSCHREPGRNSRNCRALSAFGSEAWPAQIADQ